MTCGRFDEITGDAPRADGGAEPAIRVRGAGRRDDLGDGLAVFGDEQPLTGTADPLEPGEAGGLEFGDADGIYWLRHGGIIL
jgi:hypothetical protein